VGQAKQVIKIENIKLIGKAVYPTTPPGSGRIITTGQIQEPI
jgi:hypothetical protein